MSNLCLLYFYVSLEHIFAFVAVFHATGNNYAFTISIVTETFNQNVTIYHYEYTTVYE